MSKSRFVTGLRAVEQLLANRSGEVKKLLAEYRTSNPRVEAVIGRAKELGVEIQEANRARLKQITGESRHQGLVAEIKGSLTVDEAGLRALVEERATANSCCWCSTVSRTRTILALVCEAQMPWVWMPSSSPGTGQPAPDRR